MLAQTRTRHFVPTVPRRLVAARVGVRLPGPGTLIPAETVVAEDEVGQRRIHLVRVDDR